MKKNKQLLIIVSALSIMLSGILGFNDVLAYEPDISYNLVDDNKEVLNQNEFAGIVSKIESYKRKKYLKSNDFKQYNQLLKAIDNYKDYIRSLNTLSDNELKEQNYTESQIFAIRNYDGSDEMTARAAASVTGTLNKTEYKYNSSTKKTYLTATFTVKWKGTPIYKHDDIIAIGIGGSEAGYFDLSHSLKVNKAGGNSNTNTRYTVYSGAGVSAKFKIQDPHYFTVFESATLTYRGIAGGKVTVSGISAIYCHWELSLKDPSFDISCSGPSISFSVGSAWTTEYRTAKTLRL